MAMTIEELRGLLQPSAQEQSNALSMGLLGLGSGLLANSTGHYGQFAPALGAGMNQGLHDWQQTSHLGRENRMQDVVWKLKLDAMQREQDKAAMLDKMIGNTPYGSSATNIPAYFNGTANQNTLPDMAGYQQAQAQNPPSQMSLTGDPMQDRVMVKMIGPEKYMEQMAKKYEQTPEMRNFNAPGEFGQATRNRLASENLNKPITFDDRGRPVANSLYQNYELKKAKAGASNTSIKIDNKTGESLAKEIGPMMAESKNAAEGANQQLDIANKIDAAINSGNLYAGPGAGLKMYATQIGQVSGLIGQNDTETLANTRSVIQGLAQFTLAGRKSLKGQGQISDKETELLTKAMSGNIGDLTLPELTVISNAAKRVANVQIETHKRNMNVMRKKPELQSVADFYDVPETSKQNINPGGLTIPIQNINIPPPGAVRKIR